MGRERKKYVTILINARFNGLFSIKIMDKDILRSTVKVPLTWNIEPKLEHPKNITKSVYAIGYFEFSHEEKNGSG